jgi:hypothetical protein
LKWGISGEETSRPWLFVALRPSGFSTHCGAVGTRPKRQPQAPRPWHFNAFYKVRKLESLHIWEVTYLKNQSISGFSFMPCLIAGGYYLMLKGRKGKRELFCMRPARIRLRDRDWIDRMPMGIQ